VLTLFHNFEEQELERSAAQLSALSQNDQFIQLINCFPLLFPYKISSHVFVLSKEVVPEPVYSHVPHSVEKIGILPACSLTLS
jgi:hypothetical protein